MRGKIFLYASLVAALIVSMTMSGVVIADPTAKVTIEPSSITHLFPGDTFTIDLNIYDVVGLNAWQGKIYFNPYMLKVLGATEGPFLKDPHPGQTFFLWKVGPLGDWVIAGATYKKAFTADGSGNLASITFQCIGSGSTKLALEAKLLDVSGYTIEVGTNDGQVTQKAVAEVTGRWEKYQRCPSDTLNTLYAKVADLAPPIIAPVQVNVSFYGLTMEGKPIHLNSPVATIGHGQEVVLSVTFDTLKYGVGAYDFTARAYFSYDGLTWYRGEKAKTLSFVVYQV